MREYEVDTRQSPSHHGGQVPHKVQTPGGALVALQYDFAADGMWKYVSVGGDVSGCVSSQLPLDAIDHIFEHFGNKAICQLTSSYSSVTCRTYLSSAIPVNPTNQIDVLKFGACALTMS